MAFFTIRPRHFSEDLAQTVEYLGLEKVDEKTYKLPNGKLLELHDDHTLEPPEDE